MATVAAGRGRERIRPYSALGARLSALMARRRLKVDELSQISGVPRSTIYSILDGDSEEPKASNLGKLAAALGTSREKLTAGLY